MKSSQNKDLFIQIKICLFCQINYLKKIQISWTAKSKKMKNKQNLNKKKKVGRKVA